MQGRSSKGSDMFGQGFANEYHVGARASAKEQYYKKKLDNLLKSEQQAQENERRTQEAAQAAEKAELVKLAEFYKSQTEELRKTMADKQDGIKTSSVMEGAVDIRKDEGKDYSKLYLDNAKLSLHKAEGEGN